MNWDDMFRSAQFSDTPRSWAFRGQPQEYKNLAPSFSRAVSSSAYSAAELIERALVDDFRKHYELLPDRSSDMPQPSDIGPGMDLKCLSVMQHYEVPTRLLDWTSDPWIALYFACTTEPSANGELWIYDRSILARQSLAPASALSAIEARVATSTEPSALDRRSEHIIAEVHPRLTPRMKQQLAHHTVAANVFEDHAQLLNSLAEEAAKARPDAWYFRRFVIEASCKPKLLKFLADHKLITAGTIFPDVVGLGRYLRWQFESLRTMLT
jgi:hypothetical protein